jgi:hypothetical protein
MAEPDYGQIGDVLYVTKFFIGEQWVGKRGAWAIVVGITDARFPNIRFIRSASHLNSHAGPDVASNMITSKGGGPQAHPCGYSDRYTVVEPDDWPDEVCAAVAMYRLGVE